MANVPNCNIEVSEFKLQLQYYIHFRANIFRKDMKSLIPPAMVWIVPFLFFYKDGLGIK